MRIEEKDFDSFYEEANYASTIGKYDEAFGIFTALAQAGHVGATVALGDMYLRGEGVLPNVQKGLEMLQLAASCGHSTAAFNLGALHRTGNCGVPIDLEKSRQFFLRAKELGCELPIEKYV